MEGSALPVYFFSHGGPNIMYDTSHPVYEELKKVGKAITNKKPRAIVVFSAHWQAESNAIEVNTAEDTDLIYDFYGFPTHYYKETFAHFGSKAVAMSLLEELRAAKIEANGVERGLDHGVWACFKVAFNPDTNPLSVPIVQVSLPMKASVASAPLAETHFRLGKALAPLRHEGIQFIVSGMAIHNLREFMRTRQLGGRPHAFAENFDQALKDAMEGPPAKREQRMVEILDRDDINDAHPTLEHLLPLFIGSGMASKEPCSQLWTKVDGTLGWAMYRLGDDL